jgi:hypothetical protein
MGILPPQAGWMERPWNASSEKHSLEVSMTVRRVLASASTLAALAIALGVAIGQPPPTEPTHPGMTVGGVVTLAGTNGDVHVGTGS